MKNILIGVALAIAVLGGGFVLYLQYSGINESELASVQTNEAATTAQKAAPKATASATPTPADHTFAPEEVSPSEFSKLTVRGDVPKLGFDDRAKQYYWKTGTGIYVVRNLKKEGPDLGNMTLVGGDAYRIPSADVSTFVLIQDSFEYPQFAKDKNHVYYHGMILLLADPVTFTEYCTASWTGSTCVRDKDRIFLVKENGTITLEDGTPWAQ